MSVNQQPEALRLADALDAGENFYAESSLHFDRQLSETAGEAAAELRRLHSLNDELLEALRDLLRRTADDEEYGPDHAVTKARAAIAKATGEIRTLYLDDVWAMSGRAAFAATHGIGGEA